MKTVRIKSLLVMVGLVVANLVSLPTAAQAARAEVVSPTPGSTLTSTSATFQWTAGTATQYWLFVGTHNPGSDDLYNQDRGTNLSATVTGLPSNGIRIYVRLFSLVSGSWLFHDVTYVAYSAVPGVSAQMTAPAPGSTLTSSTTTFQWNGGTNAVQYWLNVGTTSGGYDLYDSDRGTNLNATVAGLPTDGSTLYVRLWSLVGAYWQSNDYTYTAVTSGSAKAQMTSPAPSSTLASSAVTFQWNGGSGVSEYWLEVGTHVGAFDIYGADQGTSLSRTVSGLPTNGSTVYVRLWSLINSAWQWNDYTYTAVNGSSGTAKAQMTTPAPSSTLTSSTVTFQWSGGTGVSAYGIYVGTSAGHAEILNRDMGTGLSTTVSNLPTNGSTIYVRLWSEINGTWVWNDYTYTAMTSGSSGTAKAEMSSPAPGSTLTASTVTFQWSGGTGVSAYGIYVGTSAGHAEIVNRDMGTGLSTTVSNLPTNGSTVYVRLWSEINGTWVWNDYTYTAMTSGSSGTAKAQMSSPAPSSTLTSSAVTFQWSGGTGVSQYWLEVGTGVGRFDIYGADQGTSLSRTVSNLPTDGSTVYVRLWSMISGTWVYNDYTYTAMTAASSGTAKAQMSSPAPSSTLTSSTVTFQWTGGTGVSDYWLEVGTHVGGFDIYGADQGTSLSRTVMGLPANGTTIYVRLWSMISGTWVYNDYTYTSN